MSKCDISTNTNSATPAAEHATQTAQPTAAQEQIAEPASSQPQGIQENGYKYQLVKWATFEGDDTGMIARDGDIIELDDDEFWLVSAFLGMMRGDRGWPTPIESLLMTLVRRHAHHALTPELVNADVEEFMSNFKTLHFAAARFARQYPNLMADSEATM